MIVLTVRCWLCMHIDTKTQLQQTTYICNKLVMPFNKFHNHFYQVPYKVGHNLTLIYTSIMRPRLFESSLSEPSVIRTPCRILKSQKMVWFSVIQVINEMPVWFLDIRHYYITVQWIEKYISRHDIIGCPHNWLTIMC